MRRTAQSHWYEVRTTATDTSSQNGIVERPHRTFKEKMRCMLYSSQLGTEFWADAIMHVTWLYNRTYHSTVKMTPLQAYTGQIPARHPTRVTPYRNMYGSSWAILKDHICLISILRQNDKLDRGTYVHHLTRN